MYVVVAFTNRDLGSPEGEIGHLDKFGCRERLDRVSGQILVGQRKSGQKTTKIVRTQNAKFGLFGI